MLLLKQIYIFWRTDAGRILNHALKTSKRTEVPAIDTSFDWAYSISVSLNATETEEILIYFANEVEIESIVVSVKEIENTKAQSHQRQ